MLAIIILSLATLITSCGMYYAFKKAIDICGNCKDDCNDCPYADF